MNPRETGLLQRHVGDHQIAVTLRVETARRGCGLARSGRKTPAPESRGGDERSRAVVIDHDLLAFVAEREHLHAAVGKEPEGLADVEQRGVLDAQTPRNLLQTRLQGDDVGRTILQPHQFAALVRAAVGIGVNPVETQAVASEILLGGGIHYVDIRDAHSGKILRGHAGQHFIAFERHHTAEAAAQKKGVGTQPASEVQHRVAFEEFVGGARLARRLLEGQRRQDALRRGVRREFLRSPREVLDLRGHEPGVGDGAVQSHLQRVAAPCGGDGAPHFVREQEGVFFGGNHVRKDTFFFGSPLHAARVASAKTA